MLPHTQNKIQWRSHELHHQLPGMLSPKSELPCAHSYTATINLRNCLLFPWSSQAKWTQYIYFLPTRIPSVCSLWSHCLLTVPHADCASICCFSATLTCQTAFTPVAFIPKNGWCPLSKSSFFFFFCLYPYHSHLVIQRSFQKCPPSTPFGSATSSLQTLLQGSPTLFISL